MQKGPETKKSELLVLDPKRSNAINIGMTVLPAVHVIKAAILNFDEFAISKEGIEVWLPSDRCTLEPCLDLVTPNHPLFLCRAENPDYGPHRGGETEDARGSDGQS